MADIGRWLQRVITPGDNVLWPTACNGLTMDPCNVQSGASGVGLFLCQLLDRVSDADPGLGDLLRTVVSWVCESVEDTAQRPPGLYFGLSGAAWFLAEAAGRLDDPDVFSRASELALAVPTSSFNPDLTHGTAGIGLGQLHLWRRTGDARFLERALLSAKSLAATARPGPDGLVWQATDDIESSFAGKTFYGFAHGNAGIAYFLLCAAAALSESTYCELALDAVETLLRVVTVRDGAARWDSGPHMPYAWPHWCNGSAGVGSTLIRTYTVTADERYRCMAELGGR